MNEPPLHTRRDFLRTGMLGGALSWTVPGFLHATMQDLHAAAAADPLPGATGKDSPILVVVQLAGGNDGLNTVVPYANDDYRRARPRLAVSADDVLRLNDDIGFHPSLAGLKSLYDDGILSVIQGVGYPNPNRSHFRSMEIWQTASDSDRNERHGWVGRYFDNQCSGEDPGVGIAIGKESPQAFAASRPKGITFQTPEQYRFVGADEDSAVGMAEMAMRERLEDSNEGGSVNSLSGARRNRPGESPLAFLERTAMDAQASSDTINEVVRTARNRSDYPASRLARDLKTVGKLIAGGLSTRIYYVSQGGFDTHSNQLSTHERLLREYAEALKAFMLDMKEQGNQERVQVLTFSEFGRRVKENASGGTDHGAAAPVFVAGGTVKGGIVGDHPSLAPEDLLKGDVRFGTDFRSVYATLLEGHLQTESQSVLKGVFSTLDLLA